MAISDDRGVLAVGYEVWPAREVFSRLERAVPDEGVAFLVVGYPLTLRGEAGPKAHQVDRFIQQLAKRGYVVRRWDERYTTADASRALSQLGVSQRKQRGKIDMSAAVLMLQSYLDAHPPDGEDGHGG